MDRKRTKVKNKSIYVSVIVPIFNEDRNIAPLASEIEEVFRDLKLTWECIWVDDASTDNSRVEISSLRSAHRSLFHKRNMGQSRALASGIAASRGELIITLDGDGQNDPRDIPILIKKLKEGYDLIQGVRIDRQDNVTRTRLSKLANKLARVVLKSKFSDLGCTLRVVKREFLQDVELIGEVHRVLAFYVEQHGARVAEIPVNHRARKYGVSKYGYNRILKFSLDLVLLSFLMRFREKSLYYFGFLGMVSGLLGLISLSAAIVLRLLNIKQYLDTSLMVGGLILSVNSVLFIGLGLLAEIIVRLSNKVAAS